MQEWFTGYCRGFYSDNEPDNRNYRLKEEHTEQVCARMRQLTAGEGLPEEDRLLAEAVALFHDVGRFEQYRRFRTFKDSISVNHAALSVSVLQQEGLLASLTGREGELISRAVGLHNAFLVPADLTAEARRFVTLVRDADKLDIWRLFTEQFALPPEERPSALSLGIPETAGYSAEVLASIRRGEMVRLASVSSLNDFKLLQLSWLYDLNFPTSYRLVAEADYIGRLGALLPATGEIAAIIAQLRYHVQERQASGAN